MSTTEIAPPRNLGFDSAGLRMSPEEFDAVDAWDRQYRYELVDGVVVVNPLPSDAQADPNELLGFLLSSYRFNNPNGSLLNKTSQERYIRVRRGRRIADRVVWVGCKHRPVSDYDTPSIAIEFVSSGKRNRDRDYNEKSREYLDAGVEEYWIFDRFTRTMTVHRKSSSGIQSDVLKEDATFQCDLLPGFELSVKMILDEADAAAEAEEQKKRQENQA